MNLNAEHNFQLQKGPALSKTVNRVLPRKLFEIKANSTTFFFSVRHINCANKKAFPLILKVIFLSCPSRTPCITNKSFQKNHIVVVMLLNINIYCTMKVHALILMSGSLKENTYILSHTHNLPINIRVMLGEALPGVIVIWPIIIHLVPICIMHIYDFRTYLITTQRIIMHNS